ncbi:MAG: hypothetical protein QOF46_1799 [Paraburkholderia sp.]|nr:hypothetical protein [Paraburkholderia sp.]
MFFKSDNSEKTDCVDKPQGNRTKRYRWFKHLRQHDAQMLVSTHRRLELAQMLAARALPRARGAPLRMPSPDAQRIAA